MLSHGYNHASYVFKSAPPPKFFSPLSLGRTVFRVLCLLRNNLAFVLSESFPSFGSGILIFL